MPQRRNLGTCDVATRHSQMNSPPYGLGSSPALRYMASMTAMLAIES